MTPSEPELFAAQGLCEITYYREAHNQVVLNPPASLCALGDDQFGMGSYSDDFLFPALIHLSSWIALIAA